MLRDTALLSRRIVLAGLGAGAAGAVAATAPVFSFGSAGGDPGREPSRLGRTSLQTAGHSEWSGLVGQTFAVGGPSTSHMLRVAAVTAFPRSGPRPAELGRSQAFSVVFEPVAGPPPTAADGLYQLVHRSFPPLPIYMGAPVGPGAKARLIAVFN